jgi:hypothetical protein
MGKKNKESFGPPYYLYPSVYWQLAAHSVTGLAEMTGWGANAPSH